MSSELNHPMTTLANAIFTQITATLASELASDRSGNPSPFEDNAMAVKPNGGLCSIREPIIEDPASGLTLQFQIVPGSTAPVRLIISGDLPYGSREILFDRNGIEAGAGTAVSGSCRPSWLRKVKG
jgi:hypothetical protein